VFNSQKNQQVKKQKIKAPVRDTAVTILTSGCHFNGKLYCRGSSRIGGKIEGQIISEGLLIIEEEAVITAEIKADEAIIQGTVRGKLQAGTRVELCASSHFEGDIATPVLSVKEGAQFNGRSTMTGQHQGKERHGEKNPKISSIKGGGQNEHTPQFDLRASESADNKAEVAMFKVPDIQPT
jgi:cytoskeletal protein CcmA (bactofilin family)